MSTEPRVEPIRTALRMFYPAEMRLLNAAHHAGAEVWQEDVDELVKRIRGLSWNHSISIDSVRLWATHPDERVLVAILTSELPTMDLWRQHGREITALIAATDARFRPEGEIWNPTLDALASLPWYRWSAMATSGQPSNELIREHADDELVSAIVTGPEPYRTLYSWIQEKVVPELHMRRSSTEFAKELLTSTKSHDLATAVVTHVSPDVDFVRWLTLNRPEQLKTLAARRDLDAEVERTIWQIAIQSCEDRYSRIPAPAIFEALWAKETLPTETFGRLIDLLQKNPWQITRSLVQSIVRLYWLERNPETDTEYLIRLFEFQIRRDATLLDLLLDYSRETPDGEITTDRVRKMAQGIARFDPTLLYRLTDEHMNKLEPEDWIDALNRPQDGDLISQALIRIRSARGHSQARAFIFRHGSENEILTLLEETEMEPGEERLAALGLLRVADEDFDENLKRWPNVKAALEPQDLAPLLQSKDGAIRQKAILLLGEINARPVEPSARGVEPGAPLKPKGPVN